MQADLPEAYYLDNVLTLFEHVGRVYADLLETEIAAGEQRFAGVLAAHLEGLNAQLGRKDLDPLVEVSLEQWEQERRR